MKKSRVPKRAARASSDALREALVRKVDSLRGEILRVSRAIYDHPELGMEEHKAVRLLTGVLRKHGFSVECPVAGLETAFSARLKGGAAKPTVAFLAEYDALPKIGHGCGHNFIGTAGTFAGIAFEAIRQQIPGQVLVMGTPAEETVGGKILMLERGAFTGVDAAMMVHPSTETRVRAVSLAAEVIEFEFLGRTAHAAAAPWLGINALDALVETYVSINNLRKQLLPSVRLPGIITYGGERANVVPDRAVGVFSVRADTKEHLKEVLKKVIRCARAAAMANGARLRYRMADRMYYEMRSNATLERVFERNWRAVGGKIVANPLKGSGSLDLGNMSHRLPCIHPSIAIARQKTPTHSVVFRDATLTERAAEQLIRAIKALALSGLDILLNKDIYAEMKEEFRKQKR
jgi:amidohydrolase